MESGDSRGSAEISETRSTEKTVMKDIMEAEVVNGKRPKGPVKH